MGFHGSGMWWAGPGWRARPTGVGRSMLGTVVLAPKTFRTVPIDRSAGQAQVEEEFRGAGDGGKHHDHGVEGLQIVVRHVDRTDAKEAPRTTT